MSTQLSTIEYILDQLSSIEKIRTRKMFGEYALYCNEKVVALVCDDDLFIKITEEGKIFLGEEYEEGFPYPGAHSFIKMNPKIIENHEKLCEIIRITEKFIPFPKIKKKNPKRDFL